TFKFLSALITGAHDRDLQEDAGRLLSEYRDKVSVEVSGIENIPDGGLLIFNHPNNDILIPALLDLIVKIKEFKNREVSLVMTSEIMLFANLNEKVALPGSIKFIERLHGIYPKNIISAPTVTSRKDFVTGRAKAARKVIERLREGQIVAISPEGHVEIDNVISPVDTFHRGSGALARLAGELAKPVVPVAFWEEGKGKLKTEIGQPFYVNGPNDLETVKNMMERISLMLPDSLRGPFKSS
ncbi:MAG: hypothetical protein UX13_C0039G0018, partial [Candidatus Woesebacteria bacterium GW2011_GWB1_45_5]